MSYSYLQGVNVSGGHAELRTVGGCLQSFAEAKPDGDAAVFCSTTGPRVVVSWKELYNSSYKMARVFVTLCIKPGECIAIASRIGPDWLYATFGAMLAGARVTSLVFNYTDGSDVIKLLEKIGNCSVIVLDPGLQDRDWTILKSLLEVYTSDGKASSTRVPSLRNLVFVLAPENENVTTIHELMDNVDVETELPDINANDIALLFQTSGSTGAPKLVAHTYSSCINMAETMKNHVISNEEIYFCDRPFTWAGGFPFGLFDGQTRVTLSGFSPEPDDYASFVIDIIRSEKCTLALIFLSLIHEFDQRHIKLPFDWPLKTILTGGQPITSNISRCIGRICERMYIIYGGTEFGFASGLLVDNPDIMEDYANGQPMAGDEMKVVDKDGAILPCNERGELYIRSPALFKEYVNDPEKTAAVRTLDGWYKTDDLARINEVGCVYVEGRLSDMIISGAIQISPAILESVLKSFPGVRSAIVVPVQDDVMNVVVCACVCIDSGCVVTENDLSEFMESIHNKTPNLCPILPKNYIILDKLPEESNGKISRKMLKVMVERQCHK